MPWPSRKHTQAININDILGGSNIPRDRIHGRPRQSLNDDDKIELSHQPKWIRRIQRTAVPRHNFTTRKVVGAHHSTGFH